MIITYEENIFYKAQGEDRRRTLAMSFLDFWRNVKNYNFVPNKKLVMTFYSQFLSYFFPWNNKIINVTFLCSME